MDAAIETEVLIIGAGPCGMTAALALERAGVKATMVDKRPETRQYSQAAILWPRTLEVLDLLGIVEEWRPKSLPLRAFNLDLDGQTTALELHVDNSPFPQPWAVGQDVTEAILQSAVRQRGVDLQRPVEAAAVQLSATGVHTTLRLPDGSSSTVQSNWIIGCEGSHSLVREAAGIQREGAHNAGVQLIQGDVRLRGPLALDSSRGYLFSVAPRESMLVVPQSVDGHFRVLLTIPDTGEEEAPTLEYLQMRAQQIVPGLELYDPSWLNRFRVQHEIATTFRSGRALIAGDAAHVWVPIGGQGMNVGMQDAFDLGWKLGGVIRGELPPDTTLDSFTDERRPIGKGTVAYTEKAYDAILDPKRFLSRLGRKIIPRVISLSMINELVVDHLGQLDFAYPQSRLVQDHNGTNGPAAGERAPEALVTFEGKTIRFFDLYRPGRWLLLLWDPSPEQLDQAGSRFSGANSCLDTLVVDTSREGRLTTASKLIRDIGQFAKRAFGVSGPVAHVIRPDGVIGFRGKIDSETLGRYIAQNLLRR